MLKVSFLVLLFATCALAQSPVTQTTVAGKTAFAVMWKTNVNYEMYDVKKGDTIVLTWAGGFHDAVVVPDSSDPCSTPKDKYIKPLADASMGGTATYTVDTDKSFYIICTVGEHCSTGKQRIMFMTPGSSHSSGNSTTSGTPPSPPMMPGKKSNSTASSNSAAVSSNANTVLAAVFGAAMLLAAFY